MGAPAHGARARPLIAAPHHHVRLVVFVEVEHGVARAKGGVGGVGGAFLDALLFAHLRELRAPRLALGLNGRLAHAVAAQPVGARLALGQLLAPGAAARFWVRRHPAADAHRAVGAVRLVRAPLRLALAVRLPLAAMLGTHLLGKTPGRLVAVDALAPNLDTAFTDHALETLVLLPLFQVGFRFACARHGVCFAYSFWGLQAQCFSPSKHACNAITPRPPRAQSPSGDSP